MKLLTCLRVRLPLAVALTALYGACSTNQSPVAVAAEGEAGEGTASEAYGESSFTVPGEAGTLAFEVPATWVSETPTSSMRAAQYALPGEEGSASLVVYWFGGGGGTVEANIQRWVGQFQTPEGGAVEPTASSKSERDGLTIHELELYGTYVAEVRPGASERLNEPGWGLLAAVIETPEGPYFIKVVGPGKTIRAAKAGLATLLETVLVRG